MSRRIWKASMLAIAAAVAIAGCGGHSGQPQEKRGLNHRQKPTEEPGHY